MGYRASLEGAMQAVRWGADRVLDSLQAYGQEGVPKFNYMTGGYSLDEAYEPDDWGRFQWVGYLAGKLWLLHSLTGAERYLAWAAKLARQIGAVLASRPPRFTAAGSDIFYGLCLGYQVTKSEELRRLALAATDQFARLFHPQAGVFFQLAGGERVVIDTALNLLPFFWAAKFDRRYAEYAYTHNRTILNLGLVREDGSTYQAVSLDRDTLQVQRRHTLQGYSDASTWARGQAWGIHNFTNAYEATGEAESLATALKLSEWYISHLPEDFIPYYDFDDPQRPQVPRDSCAAIICCNAFLRLVRFRPDLEARYRPVIQGTFSELTRHYLSPGGVLLHGSWGRLRREKAAAGIGRFPQEDIMPYGNYWIAEYLYRELAPDWGILGLRSC